MARLTDEQLLYPCSVGDLYDTIAALQRDLAEYNIILSSQHGRRIRELERQNQELKRQLELIPEAVRILYIPVEPTKEPT